MIKNRFIYGPSFDIYQGIGGGGSFAGLYDYGPVGCALKNNLIKLWKDHFILEEDMLEIGATTITPDIVFHFSGHKAKFLDHIVVDTITHQPLRADHALEEWVEKELKDNKTLSEHQKTELKSLMTLAGGMDQGELQETFNRYGVTNAENGNVLSEVKPFNLMFQAQMGPLGDNPVFLRPETAQGIFVNFPRLLRCNNDKLPFGAATIGTSYRNEIAPRKKLIRTREFEMAEIEYFYDPQNVKHLRIAEVENVSVPFLTADDQVAGKQEGTFCTIKAALETGLLSNENLAYFIARTWLFYKEVGLNMSGVRFRQHLRKEMAHYAKDCWDGEILTSYGWIETNGLADRSAFDLTCHAEGTKKPMVAPRILEKPRKEQHCIVDLDKGKIGKHFQKLAKNVTLHFDEMDMPQKFALRDLIQSGESYKFTGSCGNDFELDKSMFKGNFWFFLKK
jgi:glycyl-tRNA synthetase